jgi:hypothetical protein
MQACEATTMELFPFSLSVELGHGLLVYSLSVLGQCMSGLRST